MIDHFLQLQVFTSRLHSRARKAAGFWTYVEPEFRFTELQRCRTS